MVAPKPGKDLRGVGCRMVWTGVQPHRVRQRPPVKPAQTPRLACWEAEDGPSTAALRLQWKPQLGNLFS